MGQLGVQGRHKRLKKALLTLLPCHSTRQKSQTLNKDRVDGRLQVNLQGWKKFAWFPYAMHFKITIYNLLCCLTENLLCCLVYFIPTTDIFKTFLGVWSCFSFTAIKIHALHKCMGNVNGYRGQNQAARSVKNVWIDTALFNNPVKTIKTRKKYFCSKHTTKTRYYSCYFA